MQRLDAQQATLSAFELEDALGTRALLDAESFLGAKSPFWQERLVMRGHLRAQDCFWAQDCL